MSSDPLESEPAGDTPAHPQPAGPAGASAPPAEAASPVAPPDLPSRTADLRERLARLKGRAGQAARDANELGKRLKPLLETRRAVRAMARGASPQVQALAERARARGLQDAGSIDRLSDEIEQQITRRQEQAEKGARALQETLARSRRHQAHKQFLVEQRHPQLLQELTALRRAVETAEQRWNPEEPPTVTEAPSPP